MKKIIVCIFLALGIAQTQAQEITNLVMIGNEGVTKDVRKAVSFVVIKRYPDFFQRLDYKMRGPLVKLRTYSDSTLGTLEGPTYEYDLNGNISVHGYYKNNLKEKKWYYYNDTGKVILQERYEQGVLVQTINPDTVLREKPRDTIAKDETEAEFQRGTSRAWIRYLQQNLNADLAYKSVKGGRVVLLFTINTEGRCVDVHLMHSVEFVLDEEAIRVIEQSPRWEPAVQNGRKVNAYRKQPLMFVKGD